MFGKLLTTCVFHYGRFSSSRCELHRLESLANLIALKCQRVRSGRMTSSAAGWLLWRRRCSGRKVFTSAAAGVASESVLCLCVRLRHPQLKHISLLLSPSVWYLSMERWISLESFFGPQEAPPPPRHSMEKQLVTSNKIGHPFKELSQKPRALAGERKRGIFSQRLLHATTLLLHCAAVQKDFAILWRACEQNCWTAISSDNQGVTSSRKK